MAVSEYLHIITSSGRVERPFGGMLTKTESVTDFALLKFLQLELESP